MVPEKAVYGRCPAMEVTGNLPLGVMCQESCPGCGVGISSPQGGASKRHRTNPPVSFPRPLLVEPDMVPCGKGERCLCQSRAMVAEFGAKREPLEDWHRC